MTYFSPNPDKILKSKSNINTAALHIVTINLQILPQKKYNSSVMENSCSEASYPLSFRVEDAKALGECIRLRHSVEIVGMKRVGISNFLRFFLNNKNVALTYIDPKEKHLFIPVDCNDLIERELFPFWILTFKRLSDAVEASPTLPITTKNEISSLFLDAIQSRDTFLTVEGIKKSLNIVIKNNLIPTIFFIRFDRIKNALNTEFFANLSGLQDSTGQKVAYVFTSFRTIENLIPDVLVRHPMPIISSLYLKPGNRKDTKTILTSFVKAYHIKPSEKILNTLIKISGDHVQYLQLSLIILSQKFNSGIISFQEDVLKQLLLQDERVALQSEEIWESLNSQEKDVLIKKISGQEIIHKEKKEAQYLWKTGLLDYHDNIFSSLFEYYINHKKINKQSDNTVDFTKKEFLLMSFLEKNFNEICEREHIIEFVWPEVESYGVSDWTIDRLTARLRTKLKKQKSKYSIVTVKTRGYKLTSP